MPRPKGSKNKPKLPKTAAFTVGNPIPGDSNVSQQPHEASSSDAVATPETLALPDAESNGAPGIGSPVTHPDGRTGVVTGSEPRGTGWAVDVRWYGDDADTSYTPVDWREMVEAAHVATAKAEPTPEPVSEEPKGIETAYVDDEPQPPAGIGTRLAEIGHEWGDTDAQLVAKEAEKKTVVSSYTKAIDILESRCRQLAAEYREAEWPETYDYRRGIKHVWNGRTGRIARTEKLGSYQVPLSYDKPEKPPVALEVTATPAVPTEPVVEVLEPVTEGESDALEPTPFDEPSEDTDEAVEA